MDPATLQFVMSAGSTVIGGLGTLFGGEESDYYGNELKDALKRAKQLSQTGIDPRTLSRLRTSQQNLASNEISGARQSAASRLQRQGVPVQVQEQILSDITQKGLGQRGSNLAELDMRNEQIKLDALNTYINGVSQAQRTANNGGEGFASLFGSGLSGLLTGDFTDVFGSSDKSGNQFGLSPKTFYQGLGGYNGK